LLYKADAISPANKKIDEEEIKFETRGGDVINVDQYISKNYTEEKSQHFFRDSFYYPIADLLRISREIMKPFVKPIIVPQLIRAFIYGRLPFLVQQKLYQKNPYTGFCTREQFNYQWLTKNADLKLRGYIKDFEDEAAIILSNNGDMKDFISHFSKKFGLSFQIDMFEGQ
jgi:hypothetical protein